MRKFSLSLLALAVTLPLLSCNGEQEQRAEFFVFGTMVEIVVRDTDHQTASIAFAELQQRFTAMHRDWHAWEHGELTALNLAFSEQRSMEVSPGIRYLIQRSQELEALSGGRFNAAMGAMIGLWGFHTSVFPVTDPVPSNEAIGFLLDAAPSASDIIFDGDSAFSHNRFVQLDFGAIAKGHATDLAIELLARHGIDEALVNAGGDLMAVGGTDENPWMVGVRRPGGGLIGGIEITGSEAVFTSGADQRYLLQTGRRYPHILDPFTGMPVQGVASVTVISDSGLLADAAATALMVAGRDSWLEVIQAFGLEAVMLVDDQGEVFVTPAMKERLIPESGTELQLTVVEVPSEG